MKKKKKTQEWFRKRCVHWAKEKAKEKARYVCEYDGCGRSKANGWQIHGSHIYAEGVHKSMSHLPENILALCAVHHVGGYWKNASEPSWHEDPVTMVAWFKNKFPKRAEELRLRAQKTFPVNWEEEWKKIKE